MGDRYANRKWAILTEMGDFIQLYRVCHPGLHGWFLNSKIREKMDRE
jgi:hypothetical protein